jgi:hypothetical protein
MRFAPSYVYVHPLPPAQKAVRLKNAVKSHNEREQEAEQEGRDLRIRRHSGDGLTNGCVVDREYDTEQEICEACPAGWKANGPIPAEEEELKYLIRQCTYSILLALTDEPSMFQGNSTRICEVMRAVQLYIRLGRSRIS